MAQRPHLASLFFSMGKSKTRLKVQLNESGIYILGEEEDERKGRTLNYDDIIGASLSVECSNSRLSSPGDPSDALRHSINVFSYPSTKPLIGSKCSRKRVCTTLSLHSLGTADKDKEMLCLLKENIEQRLLIQKGSQEGVKSFNKPILVLLNPASGKGLARKLFKEKISTMLNEAGVEFSLLETERRGHGTEIAQTTDLSKYYGIVIVSGDGLLYEVYQGLMSRTDATDAVKTPIGILPAGSGNALCCSINYSAGEPFLYDMLMHSMYVLLKHSVRPMDLVAVDTISGRLYSFLSVTWGLIADVDIESERFRNLGNARFALEGLYRIVNPRTYRGRLSFLPVYPYVNKTRSKSEVEVIDRQPAGGEEITSTDRTRSVSMPSAHTPPVTENGGPTFHTNNTNDAEPSPPLGNSSSLEGELPPLHHPVPELPPLHHSVPKSWVTIDGNFTTVIASYQSHLGPAMMASPAATMVDGFIYLVILRAPLSRRHMITFMGEFETGAHVKNPLAEVIAVKAFRLEPEPKDGIIVVDGERVPYGPIQGRVMPSVARVMTK